MRRAPPLRFPVLACGTPDGPHKRDTLTQNPSGVRQRHMGPQTSGPLRKTRETAPFPTALSFVPEFVQEWDRDRMRHFLEHRHHFFMHTRKTPEFWHNYEFHYHVGEATQEWREAKIRKKVEELFRDDACQCGMVEAYEVKRVADKIVTLCKDGGRTSRRILQEFFEYVPWGGGRLSKSWGTADEPGDMRVMYKVLDDFPQRYKNRHGNYALVTPTSTPWQRRGGPFIDPDMNKELSRRNGRIVIVEMQDRDLSLFHRGQKVTGDKGADVWDAENDRPRMKDTYDEPPQAILAEQQYYEERENQSRTIRDDHFDGEEQTVFPDRDACDFVANPGTYIGYQELKKEVLDQPINLAKELSGRGGGRSGGSYTAAKSFGMQSPASSGQLDQWETDIKNIVEYIKHTRRKATDDKLYKDENFYRLFPTIGEPVWIEKMYKPYMKLDEKGRRKVWEHLENINIHNQSGSTLLTEGLPEPEELKQGQIQDHFRVTWDKKLEYMKEYPHQDPRDEFAICEGERDARDENRKNLKKAEDEAEAQEAEVK